MKEKEQKKIESFFCLSVLFHVSPSELGGVCIVRVIRGLVGAIPQIQIVLVVLLIRTFFCHNSIV